MNKLEKKQKFFYKKKIQMQSKSKETYKIFIRVVVFENFLRSKHKLKLSF